MLQGRILRSPYAKARITALDLKPALKIPGVKAAVAKVDVGDIVRFEGDPVAAVAAITAEIAEDAMYAIAVTYDVLPTWSRPKMRSSPVHRRSIPDDRRRQKQHSRGQSKAAIPAKSRRMH